MAFGLAVYASPCGLPRFDARLASSRWSDATGRAFHPQGSNERFQSASLHLILLPQALLGAITSTEASNRPGTHRTAVGKAEAARIRRSSSSCFAERIPHRL